jgi:predicted ATPase/transcriptional regulator with XRE-family HTH domain/Tfp pilus assembly protein PilF
MDDAKAFGSWLKQRRAVLDLTQRELGRRIGCSETTIEKIEAGKRRPSIQLAELFAGYFGVPPEERVAFLEFARPGSAVEPLNQPYNAAPWTMLPARGLPEDLSVRRSPGNLPSPMTSFVGRGKELSAARTLLSRPGVRLLSMTGPPGVGKTRLAMQVATTLQDAFRDGIYLVELESVRDADSVLSMIALTLSIEEKAGASHLGSLREYLRDREMLLIADNFEQAISAAPILADLLRAAPGVKALVTSRELLRLYGEHSFPVAPLALPDASVLHPLSYSNEVMEYEAITLFVERAVASKADFNLTTQSARAVVEICTRLDGLPLAIELAAAQVSTLTPQEIVAHLNAALDLLVGGPNDAPTRQQTLRAAIEWSYSLLSAGEQALFRRVSVCEGGCTLAVASVLYDLTDVGAAGTLAGAGISEATLAILSSLVARSLLYQEAAHGETRFKMLETLREYARERLVESGEADAVRREHAHYYLALVEEAVPHLRGAQQQAQLDRLEREYLNIRAALSWTVRSGGHRGDDAASDVEVGLRMAGALWQFWEIRGYISEGRAWLTRILELAASEDTAWRAGALHAAGRLGFLQGDFAGARDYFESSLAIRRELGDKAGIAVSLNNLGILSLDLGDYVEARRFYGESLEIRRELGDKYGVAALLNNLANVVMAQGDYEEASALHKESLEIRQELGNEYGIASSLHNLGTLAMYRGDYAPARNTLLESLRIREKLGDKRDIGGLRHTLGQVSYYAGDHEEARKQQIEALSLFAEFDDKQGIAECFISLAEGAVIRGQAAEAAYLFGAANALARTIGFQLFAPDREEYERRLSEARSQLEPGAWAAQWKRGRETPLHEIVARILHAG